jgi:hypothetical protein
MRLLEQQPGILSSRLPLLPQAREHAAALEQRHQAELRAQAERLQAERGVALDAEAAAAAVKVGGTWLCSLPIHEA